MKWLLITTIGKNPGDEWIRIGIQKIINEVDPDNECILLDKEEPSKYKTPLEFDKCIWCGMPVFWSLAEEQNCKIFWWKDLMLGWPSERKNDFMILGAGSFFPWGKELETITYKEQLVKSAQDVLSRSYCVTARDQVVSKVTDKSIPYMICPAVFGVINYKKSHELKLANIMPQGSHYAVFGPQEAEIWNKKKYEISKILQQNDFTCVAHNQKEIQFAQNCGWEKIISYNGNPYELLEYYGRCGKYFGNRVHGAIIARGNNAEVWSVGYDSRQEAVKLSGARISKPSELNLDEIASWAASDIKAEPFVMDLEFEKQKEIVKRFMLAGKTAQKTQSKPIADSSKKRILFVRTDSIGDNVLASAMLPHIYEKYGNPEITVVCQEHIAQLYQHCLYVNNIITFNRKQAVGDEAYRENVVAQLRALKPDIAMNSVFSREPLTDIFTIASQAKELIALEGDLSNISAEIKNRHDQFYTKLLPSDGENKSELLRHKDFLAGLNIDTKSIEPLVWTTKEDEKFADEFFKTNGLESEKTIALFPAAQHCHKIYNNYKAVLQNFREFNFLILGGNDAKEYAAEICENFPDNCKDLTGKTTIRQMAEIIRRCRLYLGADSAGVHIACAVGTENVALLGGGHFGRFIPYSQLTSIVCLPLDCFGCNWKCKYQKAHCVNDIEPKVVDCAIRQALQRKSDRPRIFVQGDYIGQSEQNQPLWKTFDGMLDTDSVEIIPVGEIPQQIYQNWQGKLCLQKGKFSDALKHFTKALKINPYDRNTVLNCGKILAEHNKSREAKTLYNCYLQKYPDDKEMLCSLAKLCINKTVKNNDRDDVCLVSAIVSTYNAEKFIRGCLEDLENQTIAGELEIIVVNSGSEQNEEKIVKEFQQKYKNIVYIKTEQREGIYSAWNRAVKVAKGKFITNANTDDRHSKDAFEIMANTLQTNPGVGLVYGDQIRTKTANDTFENNHGIDVIKQPEYSHERLLFGCCTGSQPMWRKSLHEKIGYFDETLTCAGDWEFWLRISEKYKFKHIPEFLGLYYHNEDGIEHGRKIHSLYERYVVGKRYGNPYISVIPIYQSDSNPLVTIIMPAYNAAEYIASAIESVLIQNYRNFELVIVDDGSADNTKNIINSFKNEKIKYFYQENAGASSARNRAIKEASGDFIITLDADDMMTADFVAKHLQEFAEHPDADLIYCDDCLLDKNDKIVRVIKRDEYTNPKFLVRDILRCGYLVVPFRTCIRKSVFDKIGSYDEKLIVAEDFDMMRRFLKAGLVIHHLRSALYLRRIAQNSLSRNCDEQKAKSHFEVVGRFINTFTCDELFPDTAWDKIPDNIKQLQTKCLAAVAVLAIGQIYVKTNANIYAKAAFELACSQLNDCLEIDPGNQLLQQLLQKCQAASDKYAAMAEQEICQPA